MTNDLLTIDTDGGGKIFNIRVFAPNGSPTEICHEVEWHPVYTRLGREQFENALSIILPQCADNPIEIGQNLAVELDRLYLHVDISSKMVMHVGL